MYWGECSQSVLGQSRMQKRRSGGYIQAGSTVESATRQKEARGGGGLADWRQSRPVRRHKTHKIKIKINKKEARSLFRDGSAVRLMHPQAVEAHAHAHTLPQ